MSNNELVRVRLKIVGRVQGVFYRQTTKDKAKLLGLSGWVKNDDDGAVSVEAVGPRASVDELIRWCHQGPPSSLVKDVKVSEEETTDAASHHGRFDIR